MTESSFSPTADFDSLRAEVERLGASAEPAATAALAQWLSHRSWALRDLVVAAIARRESCARYVVRVLEDGEWWARASACDVLARCPDVAMIPPLLRAVEDRNVSLQRSAVRALLAIARETGAHPLAEAIAALAPEARRRVAARLAHQAPHAVEELLAMLATLPVRLEERDSSATGAERGGDPEAEALRRFRGWLLETSAVEAAAR